MHSVLPELDSSCTTRFHQPFSLTEQKIDSYNALSLSNYWMFQVHA
jgi:hypothetical protein